MVKKNAPTQQKSADPPKAPPAPLTPARVKAVATPEEQIANSIIPVLHPADAVNATAVKNLVNNQGTGKTPSSSKNEKAIKKADEMAKKLEENKRANEASRQKKQLDEEKAKQEAIEKKN